MTQAPVQIKAFGGVGPLPLDRLQSMNALDDAHEGLRAVHRTAARRVPPLLSIVYGNRP